VGAAVRGCTTWEGRTGRGQAMVRRRRRCDESKTRSHVTVLHGSTLLLASTGTSTDTVLLLLVLLAGCRLVVVLLVQASSPKHQ
jgi:hypothetical protein